MKRHHYIALGALAALALIIVLWPRHADDPLSTELPATDNPALNPDAPQGTDGPGDEARARPDAGEPGNDGGISRTVVLRDGGDSTAAPVPSGVQQVRPLTEEERLALADAGMDGRTAAMNQDPRMAAYRQGIKDSIQRIKPRIAECYESALKQDPSIAGSIKITFEIKSVDGGGRVVSGEVPDSEIRSPFFEACVLEKVGGAEFPEPLEGGTVKVTYPFHFDPGGGWGGEPRDRP